MLTPSELANIESPDSRVCEAQVESLLIRVRAHTILMEESIKVLQSAGSSANCHNASHCQACAVSQDSSVFVYSTLDPTSNPHCFIYCLTPTSGKISMRLHF